MEDSMCEEIAIKINWFDHVVDDDKVFKLKGTNLQLDGKYEDEDGDIHYFKNGKYHNENAPAYITKYGYKEYRIKGKKHRIDGPAVIYSDGDYDWYINDYHIDNEIMVNWLTENSIPIDYKTWTDLDKMLFALHWGDYNGT